jgi:hypothetical protein
MASGEFPYVGAAAISDRSWDVRRDLVAEIEGVAYEVKDYTARSIDDRGLTLDIYSTGTRDEMLAYGVRYKEAVIYYRD